MGFCERGPIQEGAMKRASMKVGSMKGCHVGSSSPGVLSGGVP